MVIMNHLDECVIDGRVFEITGELSIAGAGTAKLLGKASDVRSCLISYFIKSDQGPVEVRLIEAPTVTDDGTLITPVNRNRNSDNTSDTIVYGAPTSSGGTNVYQNKVYETGTGSHTQGGSIEMPSIFVLKDNTDYIFEIENLNVATTTVSYSILWCEEEK
jgi:hypothetical protein